MSPTIVPAELTNQPEPKNFLKAALYLKGSATPQILPRVVATTLYSLAAVILCKHAPRFSLPLTPFEYWGAVLGVFLVARVNAGMDRWWEGRKLWGSIVNQSRNLAIIGYEYTPLKGEATTRLLRWVAAWPYVICESLRGERNLDAVEALLGAQETERIRKSGHMPTYVGARLAAILGELRSQGLDDFSFQRAERERAILIDDVGGCERIRSTPMPFALAIKTRRFILLFLLLLPLGLVDRADWVTALVAAMVAYPLFSLDEIAVQLQNPFSPSNLSHLPLPSICKTIEQNVLSLDAPSLAPPSPPRTESGRSEKAWREESLAPQN